MRDDILDPARSDADDPDGYAGKIAAISQETSVPIVYVVGGGAVFFAGARARARRSALGGPRGPRGG